jgi:cyclic pyranopterin monophosphate synthase
VASSSVITASITVALKSEIPWLTMSTHDSEPLTHIDSLGQAHMVDVSDRDVTTRIASASARVLLSPSVVASLRDNAIPKGDVLSTARIAGIMGAKRTSDLIPLCHPLAIHGVDIDLDIDDDGVAIWVEVTTTDRTGVEMEALTAASVAALTIIDMVKSLDPGAVITDIQIESKDGGRNGAWTRG